MSQHTILLIGDSAKDRDIIQRVLAADEDYNYTLLESASGTEGLRLTREQFLDCVLLDSHLPDIDGLTLLAAFNADPLQPPVLPVIMLISEADKDRTVSVLKNGAQDYLVKGNFSPEELRLTVRKAVEVANLRRGHNEAEATVRQSEAQFRSMAEHAPVMIWVTEPDGTCTYLSQSWYEFTGQTPETGLGFGWLDATHPDDKAEAEKIFLAANEQRAAFQLEYRLRRKDGAYRWAIDSAQPRFAETGEFLGYIGSVTDISERKEWEENLRVSEERFRRVFSNNMVAMGLWTKEGGIIGANDALLDLIGYTRAELEAGKINWIGMTPPEYHERDVQAITEIEARGICTPFEKVYLHKDGRPISVLIGGGRFDDRAETGIFYAVDITTRKQAEEKLIEQQELIARQFDEIQAVYQTAPVGLAYLDRDLRFIRINKRLAEINGLPPEETVGRTLREILPASLADKLEPLLRRILETGEPLLNLELTGETKAQPGVERVWIVNYYALKDADGAIIGVNSVVQEITERKRGEQRLAALAESLTEQRELLAIALRTGRMGAYEWRVLENTVWWSPETYELFGVDAASFKPSTESFNGLIHPDDRAELWRKTEEAIAQNAVFQHEYRIIRPDGATHWLYNRSHIGLSANGEVERITGMVTDITERMRAQAEIKRLSDYNRSVLESITDPFFTLDHEYRFTYMSSQGEKLVFREPGELIGKSIWDEFPGLLGTPFEKMYRDAMKEKIFSTVTDYYPDHDRWYEVLTYPSPHGVTVYFRDISQRKRAESNLAFLANLQRDFAPPATTREIVALASTQIADYLQLSHCLFVEIDEAQKTATVTHDKHAPDAMDLTGVYELGNFHTAEERKKLSAGTAIAINNVRDGKRPATAADSFEALGIRALITASYISQGKWKFALSAQCDKPREWRTDEQELLSELSSRIYLRLERARAEEELRESEQRFRSLFDSIDEGFCIIKMIFDENNQPRDYRFLRANPAFEKLTGLKDALGKTARELVPHLEECWFETLGRVALTGEPARFENEAAATNRWFEIHASRDGDSSSRRVAVVFSDITERKLAERERERLLAQEQRAREIAEAATRAKDEFIAVVSHELRNPLNAILGYQRLLRQSNTLDRTIQENYLDIIEKSARQQQRLIEDLLDTARIISGKLKLDIRPINFVRVLQDTLNSVRPSAQIKQIALTVDVAESVRANITGDADRLQQVIWNLLSNAIKFTPERGAVMVHLTDLSGYLRLMIADTGKGIAPHLIAQIFDRFHQADSSSTRRHGGLGLGLALVKQLVEMHGGTIEASSPGVGQGATFIVTLPMQAHVPLVTDPAPSAVPLTPSTLLTGLRILVVDDEADARDIVTAILQTQGARVTSVASAATALAVLTNTTHAFDVLVSDIGMPDTDGYELMRQVRQRGFNLPGIAVTAFGRMEDRLRALTAGFQMHVPKPIEPEELIAVIRSLVK